jgi:hypothetical protein
MGVWVNISLIGEFQPLDDQKNKKKSSVIHAKDFYEKKWHKRGQIFRI